MTCDFSEFSFGYAITDSMVKALKTSIGAAPVFANQIAEGKPGGGYDMKLPLNPLPIFLQFKIPQVLRRSSSGKPPGYTTPYYRMHLRTNKGSQHQLLLDLEASHSLVYYVTPLFHGVADLDSAFMKKGVHLRSAFIKPSKVGVLDAKAHHVSYQVGASTYWVHSEPKEIGVQYGFDNLLADMRSASDAVNTVVPVGADVVSGAADNMRRMRALNEVKDWLLGNRWRDMYPGREADAALADLLNRPFETPEELARNLGYVAQVHYGLALAFADGDRLRK